MDRTAMRMKDIRTAVEEDIRDLEEAVRLIAKVNETFTEAFWNHAGEEPISTSLSNASIATKLARSKVDIVMIAQVLNQYKEGIR